MGKDGPDHTYRGTGLNVIWNEDLCAHCGDCLRGLPEVFDVKKRPWIQVDGADHARVIAQVEACPFKALRIERVAADGNTSPA